MMMPFSIDVPPSDVQAQLSDFTHGSTRAVVSWHYFYPACSTTPWQLDGVISTLLEDGYSRESLYGCHNRTVVVSAKRGELANKQKQVVVGKYGLRNVHLYETGEEWIRYEPKAKMLALDKIFPEGIRIPKRLVGSNIIHLPTMKTITLMVLFSAFTFLVLLVLRDRMGALQLLAASAGAGILTLATKNFIERIRPEEAQQLIVVSGFSHPSGHLVSTSALYLTIAIITSRFVQHSGARAALVLAVSAVLIMIGASRVYLGVHYATDVVSGISLGAAWALVLAGFFTLFVHRGSS
jgi:membrane-associated phospholipid phosphatase